MQLQGWARLGQDSHVMLGGVVRPLALGFSTRFYVIGLCFSSSSAIAEKAMERALCQEAITTTWTRKIERSMWDWYRVLASRQYLDRKAVDIRLATKFPTLITTA